MKEIWNSFDALRVSVKDEAIPSLILMEAAEKLGALPDLHGRVRETWDRFRANATYPQLQAAAQMFLSLSRRERLLALDGIFNSANRGKMGGMSWISMEVARQIANLTVGTASARCSFSWSLHPALHLAVQSAGAGRPLALTFVDLDSDMCDLAALCAAALEIDLTVFVGAPFERLDGTQAETEISFPPLGWKLDQSHNLPKRTLDWMGASLTGRLTGEAVAIADLLAQAPRARGIISVSAGALFRTVGVEATAREELVRSARLQAILDVPSGMTYHETGITTGILVLSADSEKHDMVRFLDLSHPHFSTRTRRGRFEAKTEVSWLDAIAAPLEGNEFGRDVTLSEIDGQGRILTVSRYLSQTASKLSDFSKRYEVRGLSDLVELIRPVVLPKVDESEYVIHETAPGDVGEDGLLETPPKTVMIDRGSLRKARNQQLEAGDVVLSVKGTIGRVGIVPDAVPGRNDDDFWTVGQSMMILRPRKGIILPEVLYEYLSSDVVQQHFETLAGGAVIMSFNTKDLKDLPIPVPSLQEQHQIADAFRSRQGLHAKIKVIRDEISEHRSASWPHHDLEAR
jgi:hypothetical protein